MSDSTSGPQRDPRVAAFCSESAPEVFRAIAHQHEIWRDDPFDVESIHKEARDVFGRLLNRATTPPGQDFGRILLLLGESGSGKTHLMRAFRREVHGRDRGYCGYLQMTSGSQDYYRYILNNLIDSLELPYDDTRGETSGLKRLSTGMAEAARGARLVSLREEEMDDGALADLVEQMTDEIVRDARFDSVDFDLVKALLYLQRDDPRIKGRVLKYLRCEFLSVSDRRLLGGLVPRYYADAPKRLVAKLADIMWSVQGAALVLCVDQLEDMYNMDQAPTAFLRAMGTLRALIDDVPSSIIVISCLEDFYEKLRGHLTRPIIDRIERDPRPILLKGIREADEIVEMVAARLDHLYERAGVAISPGSTFPIREDDLRKLAGQRTRDVLLHCKEYTERCGYAGAILDFFGEPKGPGAAPGMLPPITSLEQAWNDFHTAFTTDVPDDEEGIAALLAEAIESASDEVATGHRFSAERDGRTIAIEIQGADDSVDRLLAAVCNRPAQGGGLGKQVAELSRKSSGVIPLVTPVIVRSTDFPSSSKSQIAQQLGTFIARGGRRAQVEDGDLRMMLAFREFRARHEKDPVYKDWRKEGRPLSRLKSLRLILDLDHLKPVRPEPTPAPPVSDGEGSRVEHRQPEPPPDAAGPKLEPTPPPASAMEPIVVGVTNDRAASPFEFDPRELTRHAAYLGGTGSGKTTAALNVIEQLLLRGVPAILVDRKGDLCGYSALAASPAAPDESDRLRTLRERVDVAVYTPGYPEGRPLSIAIVPPGVGDLNSIDRQAVMRQAATGLAGMMNYKDNGADRQRRLILEQAIGLLTEIDARTAPSLPDLIAFVAEEDPTLVNAVGQLDRKQFVKLAQDLEALRLQCGSFLSASGEDLDAEAMFGLGRHARPGKTRLSVVSTKFLRERADIQFWVSQLLTELSRWSSRSPMGSLQAVVLFDEADLYLPAVGKPPTKEPMENLLKRARSAGLGLLLATQSPGDFDYRCRENVRTWFLGRIKETTALAKLKPMLSEARVDVSGKLAGQGPGEFFVVRDGQVVAVRSDRCAVIPEQVGEEEILRMARATRPAN